MLVLSLVLPLLMSFRHPKDPAIKIYCMKVVWSGQVLLALAGLALLAWSRVAPCAAACGMLSCVGCVLLLLRRFRSERSIRS